jgi:hypothetical protein
MSEYNWAGKKKQKPLYKHPLLSRFLFGGFKCIRGIFKNFKFIFPLLEAWKDEFWTYDQFKLYVSASLRAAKNHINQMNYKIRSKVEALDDV